jgi:hypothetical protein
MIEIKGKTEKEVGLEVGKTIGRMRKSVIKDKIKISDVKQFQKMVMY